MECIERMQLTLQSLQDGSTTIDGARDLIRDCPVICSKGDGDTNYDLAGPGVYSALILQAFFVLFLGLTLSFVSYVTPTNARKGTKLNIARLKLCFDTAYSTSAIVYLATIASSYLRLKQVPDTGTFERNLMSNVLMLLNSLAMLAINSQLVYTHPSQIKKSRQSWGLSGVWIVSYTLVFVGDYVRSIISNAPSAALDTLCSATTLESHPNVHKPPSPLKARQVLIVAVVTLSVTFTVLILNEFIRSKIWNGLKKIVLSRATKAFFVTAWTLLNLTGLGFSSHNFYYLRKAALEQAGNYRTQWDFAQVLIFIVWLPAVYRLLLTLVKCCSSCDSGAWSFLLEENKEKSTWRWLSWLWLPIGLSIALTDVLYEYNVGAKPAVEEDKDEGEDCSEKKRSNIKPISREDHSTKVEAVAATFDENAPLIEVEEKSPLIEVEES